MSSMANGDGKDEDTSESKRMKMDLIAKSTVSVDGSSVTPQADLAAVMDLSEEEYEYDGSADEGVEEEEIVVEVEKNSDDVCKQKPESDYPFHVLSTSDILKHMADTIEEANSVLQLTPTAMRILLTYFKWDKEKLLDGYYEGDQDKLFKNAHIVNPTNLSLTKSNGNAVETCEICYEDEENMYGLECGHRFCNNCWPRYLHNQITTEGLAQSISCPHSSCKILVDDDTIKHFVTEAADQEKYQHLLANSFVECNRLIRWCPSPLGCTNALSVQWVDFQPVTCSCGFKFCFQCGHDWHDPIKCLLLKKWVKKCADDSETSRWINTHTKDCPKCHVQIEKNGGCNHMTCRKPDCRYEFCWVCMGKWPHPNGNCNRFDDDKQKGVEESRVALQRYLFYSDRYMNHMKSLKFESKLYASVTAKMELMQQNNMTWIEVQFLKKAVDTLCQCRQTLMYTYGFAFYLQKTNQCIMFEDNQGDLELATEALSEFLEKEDHTAEDLVKLKQQVQDKSGYCETRRKVLIDHVHEGNENDWWIYLDP